MTTPLSTLVIKCGALRPRCLFIRYPTIRLWSRIIHIRRKNFVFGISRRRVWTLFMAYKLWIQTPPPTSRVTRRSASRLQKMKVNRSIWRSSSSSATVFAFCCLCWCNHGIRGWIYSQDKCKTHLIHVVSTLLKGVLIRQNSGLYNNITVDSTLYLGLDDSLDSYQYAASKIRLQSQSKRIQVKISGKRKVYKWKVENNVLFKCSDSKQKVSIHSS